MRCAVGSVTSLGVFFFSFSVRVSLCISISLGPYPFRSFSVLVKDQIERPRILGLGPRGGEFINFPNIIGVCVRRSGDSERDVEVFVQAKSKQAMKQVLGINDEAARLKMTPPLSLSIRR